MTEEPHSKRHMLKSKWSKIRKTSGDTKGKGFAFTDDVSDFLQGSKKPTSPTAGTRPTQAPRIDVSVAQRWPDAAQLRKLSSGESPVPSPLPAAITGKPKKRKGLTVRFAPTRPDIIGCGGDETETPPIHISQARALGRSKSERRPEDVFSGDAVSRDVASLHRPGIGDRSQTATGNTGAHATLISAGVFGDRPPSRDSRPSDEQTPRPSLQGRTQTGYISREAEDEDGASYRARRPSIPPRKAIAPPRIQEPPLAQGEVRDGRWPSQESQQSEDPRPHMPHSDSQDSILRTQQRMRNEEAQAFSRAYRLSVSLPAAPDTSRPQSRGSIDSYDTSHSQHTVESPPRVARVEAPREYAESLSVRKKPSSSPNRPPDGRFLQPSETYPERLTPPVTPPIGTMRSGGLAPKDYIEYFRNKPPSRSNSASGQTSSPESRDSPQQDQARFSEEPPLKLDVSPSSLRGPRQDPATQIGRHNTVVYNRNETPTGNSEFQNKAVVPPMPSAPGQEQSPQSAEREIRDHGESTFSHTQSLAQGNARAFPQTPVRKVDPMAAKAFDDFSARVNQMKGVFRLTAQKERGDTANSSQWLRCAFWWLRKAKIELERQFRSQQRTLLTQAHVNMAKAWWVLTEIIEAGVGLSDSRDSEDESSLRHHTESLALWMDRHQLLPPHASLIQGQDTNIWVKYPAFPPDIEYLLGSNVPSTAARDVLPLGDSKQFFFYQSMFVNATVSTDDAQTDRMNIPCTLSIVRHWTQYRASIIVASQNGLVNVLVGPELERGKTGPTWYDIEWRPKSCSMSIKLPRGLSLRVVLDENDYRSLSTMIEYTRAIDKSFQPGQGETLVYSSQLREAQYVEKAKKQNFPDGMVKKSFLGVFENVQTEIHANWKQKVHRGYRVMLITPSTSRTLGVVTHTFDSKTSILFEVPESASNDDSVVILHAPDGSAAWRMSLVFDSRQPFNDMLNLIHGTYKTGDEFTRAKLALRSFSARPLGDSASASPSLASLDQLSWRDAAIIDRRSARPTTILNDSLRVVLSHSTGAIVDRLNLPPGTLLMRLPISPEPAITLYRQPQPDMLATSFDPRAVPATQALSSVPTLRTYAFTSLPDLHTFQELLTGYTVAFDGCPARFAITRHRMVVSLHKKWEASRVRLQLLTRTEGLAAADAQIAVFFEDFAHADAMVFPVKASDAFERGKGGVVRLVEAKFSLPPRGAVGEENEEAVVRRRFVNTEGLEYREEADDIVVSFELEKDADAFCAALPGTVHSGGKGFLKRR